MSPPSPHLKPPGDSSELMGDQCSGSAEKLVLENAVTHHVSQSPSRDESATDVETGFDDATREQVGNLARRMTSHSISGDTLINPFEGSDDPRYDPNSGKFSAEAWVRALLRIQSRDPERYPQRTAGVSFRNLNVHGWGTPTDYQKDILNVLLEGPAVFNKILGRGKRKIQILRNFDGLVKSGEMLVVLGRPGR
jgi:ATP-binding cassette, subfamily G (WHITE), member 2, PDR